MILYKNKVLTTFHYTLCPSIIEMTIAILFFRRKEGKAKDRLWFFQEKTFEDEEKTKDPTKTKDKRTLLVFSLLYIVNRPCRDLMPLLLYYKSLFPNEFPPSSPRYLSRSNNEACGWQW